MSGSKSDSGWEDQRDGELGMGVTWYKNATDKWYIVKPDPFSAAAPDSKLRPNWRLAMSKTRYGNVSVASCFKLKWLQRWKVFLLFEIMLKKLFPLLNTLTYLKIEYKINYVEAQISSQYKFFER